MTQSLQGWRLYLNLPSPASFLIVIIFYSAAVWIHTKVAPGEEHLGTMKMQAQNSPPLAYNRIDNILAHRILARFINSYTDRKTFKLVRKASPEQ